MGARLTATRTFAAFAALAVLAIGAGCGGITSPVPEPPPEPPPSCEGVVCSPCQIPLTIVVRLSGGASAGPVTVSSVPDAGIGCGPDGDHFVCGTATVRPGSYELTVRAPGHRPSARSVTIAPAPAGCCACIPAVTLDVTLAPDGDPSPPDAAVVDASQDATQGG